ETLTERVDRARLVAGRPVRVGCFQRGHKRQGYGMTVAVETRRSPPYGAYAALTLAFGGGLAAAGAAARLLGRDPREGTPLDLVVLSAATFKAARTIARDEVTSFLRAPFVEGEAHTGDEEAKETGDLQQAIGGLVTCSR